jgi:hypothetical protein
LERAGDIVFRPSRRAVAQRRQIHIRVHPSLSVVKKIIMKTRTGKIARLPQSIRDQLNQKLENSVPGNELLPWLHSLPEVQKILADHFGGRPITKSNLSDWRLGGFADWRFHREGRQQWRELIENARELTGKRTSEKGVDVSSYLGTFLLVEVGQALDRLHTVKDLDKRWKLMRLISGALSRLRNDDTREKMLRLREIKRLTPSPGVASSRAESCLGNFFSQSSPLASGDLRPA